MSGKKKSSAPISRVYAVESAERLRDLCGPHHRLLHVLEAKLDMYKLSAESQGGGIKLAGTSEGVDIAEVALAELERRLSKGAQPTDLEMEGAIEAAMTPEASFITLKKLKKPITAQTRGQGKYLERLVDQSAGLVFGTGPAGTGKTYLAVAAGVSELLQGCLLYTSPSPRD